MKKNANILRFNDIEHIEYRKGSLKFGGLLIKLMEFLRIYKDKEEKFIDALKNALEIELVKI